MPYNASLFGANGAGPAATATAATLINALVPPRQGAFTKLTTVVYTIGTTGHILTVLREKSRTTTTVAQVANDTTLTLTADPGLLLKGPNGVASARVADRAIATNDYVAWEYADGTFGYAKITGASSLVITTGTLAGAVSAGAVVWFFGLIGDTNPLDTLGLAHPKLTVQAAASATTQQVLGGNASQQNGLVSSPKQYSPLLIQSNNLTTAGTIENYQWSHAQ